MSQYVKRKRATDVASGWDTAIADAKDRIRKLEFSIKVFTQRKEAGEAFPSTPRRQANGRDLDQQHSV